jgi:hypothetical protein
MGLLDIIFFVIKVWSTRKSMSSAQIKQYPHIVDDQICLEYVISDISDQVGYFHRIPEPWH